MGFLKCFCVFFIASLVELSFGLLFCFVLSFKDWFTDDRTKSFLHIDPQGWMLLGYVSYRKGEGAQPWRSPHLQGTVHLRGLERQAQRPMLQERFRGELDTHPQQLWGMADPSKIKTQGSRVGTAKPQSSSGRQAGPRSSTLQGFNLLVEILS